MVLATMDTMDDHDDLLQSACWVLSCLAFAVNGDYTCSYLCDCIAICIHVAMYCSTKAQPQRYRESETESKSVNQFHVQGLFGPLCACVYCLVPRHPGHY